MPARRRARPSAVSPPALAAVGATLAGLATVAIAGCGAPDRAYEPTPPTFDPTPKLVIEIDEAGIRATPGPKADDTVAADPPTARQDTVIQIANVGTGTHRVHAEGLLDTGAMRAGERVVVVLSKTVTSATPYQLVDLTDRGHALTLTVTPKPDAPAP